jgi:hypothetical protein
MIIPIVKFCPPAARSACFSRLIVPFLERSVDVLSSVGVVHGAVIARFIGVTFVHDREISSKGCFDCASEVAAGLSIDTICHPHFVGATLLTSISVSTDVLDPLKVMLYATFEAPL